MNPDAYKHGTEYDTFPETAVLNFLSVRYLRICHFSKSNHEQERQGLGAPTRLVVKWYHAHKIICCCGLLVLLVQSTYNLFFTESGDLLAQNLVHCRFIILVCLIQLHYVQYIATASAST